MNADAGVMPGLALMFALGLRHGLDPDHIACIDGLTWHALTHSRRHAGWVGALFALGHGLVVTGVAFIVAQLASTLHVAAWLVAVFEWIPTALLLVVGTVNLRLLLSTSQAYVPGRWKLSLVPRMLRERSSAWNIVAIGMLFAMVFDTATQAAAWGYVASRQSGGGAALAAGLAFTAGMILTDTLDGKLVCRISGGVKGSTARRGRRLLGWLIVCLSYVVASYNIVTALLPEAELGDAAFSCVGFILVAGTLLLWVRSASGSHDLGDSATETR